MNYKGKTISKHLINEARHWLVDCYPDEEDLIEFESDYAVIKLVNLNYGGGLESFIADTYC